MSYPKPLSEKSLEKLYKEADLTQEARSYLHRFFAACANLYGAIALRHVWQIHSVDGRDGEETIAEKLLPHDIAFAGVQ